MCFGKRSNHCLDLNNYSYYICHENEERQLLRKLHDVERLLVESQLQRRQLDDEKLHVERRLLEKRLHVVSQLHERRLPDESLLDVSLQRRKLLDAEEGDNTLLSSFHTKPALSVRVLYLW
ncbi:hypothetical protein CL654_02760 [bacterium]|nr:hypothetical protein [bacterium]